MKVHIYTLTDAGVPHKTAVTLFNMMCRFIQPSYVQIYRPVILKNKATTTTVSLRAFKLDELERLVEERLLNPRRSPLARWGEWSLLIKALRERGEVK